MKEKLCTSSLMFQPNQHLISYLVMIHDTHSKQSRMTQLFLSLLAGAAGSAAGGSLFGAFAFVVEQFDGKYDDPSFVVLATGAPIFAVVGAVVAIPVGLLCGLVYGVFAANRIQRWPLARISAVCGGAIGAVIGGSLQGVQVTGDWDAIVGGWLLLSMGTVCGALGGRVGGRLASRWLVSKS